MKYYVIESVTRNINTGEVVASGSSLVKVDSEEAVKKIIKDNYQCEDSWENCEDDIRYHECSEENYIKVKEEAIMRKVKMFYYDKIMKDVDPALCLKEYNKIKNEKSNEADAVDYCLRLISSIFFMKKNADLNELSARDFFDMVEQAAE